MFRVANPELPMRVLPPALDGGVVLWEATRSDFPCLRISADILHEPNLQPGRVVPAVTIVDSQRLRVEHVKH